MLLREQYFTSRNIIYITQKLNRSRNTPLWHPKVIAWKFDLVQGRRSRGQGDTCLPTFKSAKILKKLKSYHGSQKLSITYEVKGCVASQVTLIIFLFFLLVSFESLPQLSPPLLKLTIHSTYNVCSPTFQSTSKVHPLLSGPSKSFPTFMIQSYASSVPLTLNLFNILDSKTQTLTGL